MEENKQVFVEQLDSLIRHHTRIGKCIKDIHYEVSLVAERVDITFTDGYVKHIDVTADSCLAIMHDVYKALI